MKREFTDLELQAQILWYLYGKGAWGEDYKPFVPMVKRLSNIVMNNGRNIKKQTRNLVKLYFVQSMKQGRTISLNHNFRLSIKQFINEQLGLGL